MSDQSLLILLGNQLFSEDIISRANCEHIFMAEDYNLCSYEKHHKLKILMFLAAMREKRDELIDAGYRVDYFDIEHRLFIQDYEIKLDSVIEEHCIKRIVLFEIEDKNFEEKMINYLGTLDIEVEILRTPMFKLSRGDFSKFAENKKMLRMASFYKDMRRKFNILLDDNQDPVGGKWSFDDENRKKIPKGTVIPERFHSKKSKYCDSITKSIEKHFKDHPGSLDDVWMPLTRKDALHQLSQFLEIKFKDFGIYEDAIVQNDTFLFHSVISPSLNMGLITPDDVLSQVIDYANREAIPLNSLEGFVRQILGWREFMRGVYREFGDQQIESNFFGFERSLGQSWYSGETGIPPLDDAILFAQKYGYTHHINRLMVISNLMTLCEVNPKNIYTWFMELFVDSSEWVMTPNVFGMGTFADGGIFATKPYICGSNYFLKMSDYKKGDWCDVVDGLYWRFVENYFGRLRNNPRLSFMTKTLERMDSSRKSKIFSAAENFISTNCE